MCSTVLYQLLNEYLEVVRSEMIQAQLCFLFFDYCAYASCNTFESQLLRIYNCTI